MHIYYENNPSTILIETSCIFKESFLTDGKEHSIWSFPAEMHMYDENNPSTILRLAFVPKLHYNIPTLTFSSWSIFWISNKCKFYLIVQVY